MSDVLVPADAAAGEAPVIDDSKNLPVRKRKKEDDSSAGGDGVDTPEAKMRKTDDAPDEEAKEGEDGDMKPIKRAPMSKAREIRLEQNRKAARESRRRKKNMIEELQRSVIFFSRANSSLKQQNDELTRLLMQAQSQVTAIESGQQPAAPAPGTQSEAPATAPAAAAQQQADQQQAQAQAVAQQAMYESQGFPSAAARTAAQTMNAGNAPAPAGTPAPAAATTTAPAATATQAPLPAMQTGATMQAMANFQQATAAAMASAMGMNAQVPGAVTPGQQQAYTDALNAMAMQQAVAAAGQQFPFMQFQGMQFPVAVAGQPAAAPAGTVDTTQQQQAQVQAMQEQPQQVQATEPQQG